MFVDYFHRKKGVYHKKPNVSKSLDDLNEVSNVIHTIFV